MPTGGILVPILRETVARLLTETSRCLDSILEFPHATLSVGDTTAARCGPDCGPPDPSVVEPGTHTLAVVAGRNSRDISRPGVQSQLAGSSDENGSCPLDGPEPEGTNATASGWYLGSASNWLFSKREMARAHGSRTHLRGSSPLTSVLKTVRATGPDPPP